MWACPGLKNIQLHESNVSDRFHSETYQYYTLPFCKNEKTKYKPEYLGEVLNGDRLVNTPYDIKFREDIADEQLCKRELTQAEQQKMKNAIIHDFYYQMYFDELPLWGFIGKV